jgi:hypothetical protein
MRFVQRHPMLARQLVRHRACRRVPNPCNVRANCTLRVVLRIYIRKPESVFSRYHMETHFSQPVARPPAVPSQIFESP